MPRAGTSAATIVAAAAAIADSEGLEAVTLTRVAAAVGVRPPSLYAHVDGLDDLLRRLGAHGASELASALGRAVEGRSGFDALQALFTQENASSLIELARIEKEPTLRKTIVELLSQMDSKESTDYLIELLKK